MQVIRPIPITGTLDATKPQQPALRIAKENARRLAGRDEQGIDRRGDARLAADIANAPEQTPEQEVTGENVSAAVTARRLAIAEEALVAAVQELHTREPNGVSIVTLEVTACRDEKPEIAYRVYRKSTGWHERRTLAEAAKAALAPTREDLVDAGLIRQPEEPLVKLGPGGDFQRGITAADLIGTSNSNRRHAGI